MKPLRASVLQDRLELGQVLAVGAAHGRCHQRRHDLREPRRFTSIPQRHVGGTVGAPAHSGFERASAAADGPSPDGRERPAALGERPDRPGRDHYPRGHGNRLRQQFLPRIEHGHPEGTGGRPDGDDRTPFHLQHDRYEPPEARAVHAHEPGQGDRPVDGRGSRSPQGQHQRRWLSLRARDVDVRQRRRIGCDDRNEHAGWHGLGREAHRPGHRQRRAYHGLPVSPRRGHPLVHPGQLRRPLRPRVHEQLPDSFEQLGRRG